MLTDRPSPLALVLQREAQASADGSRAALLYHDLGHVLETVHDAPEQALQAYEQALRHDPSLRLNAWSLRGLIEAGVAADSVSEAEEGGADADRGPDWKAVVAVLDAQAGAEREPRRRAEVLLEKGRILADRLDQVDQAVDSLWASFDAVAEGWLPPLLVLARIGSRNADVDLLRRVYEKQALTAEDPERRAAALRELARLEVRCDPQRYPHALELLEQAAALSIDRRAVLQQMEFLCARFGDDSQRVRTLADLAEELRRSGDLSDTTAATEAASCLREAARVARFQLDDPERTRELLQRAIDWVHQSPSAELLDPTATVLYLDMQSLAEDQGDLPLLASIFKQRLELAANDSDQQAALWLRLASVQRELGETSAAVEALKQCTRLKAGYMPALVERERDALLRADYEQLMEVIVAECGLDVDGEASQGQKPICQAERIYLAATVAYYCLGNVSRAIELCERLIAGHPTYEPACDLLGDLLLYAGEYQRLADLLRTQIEASRCTEEAAGEAQADGDIGRKAFLLGRLTEVYLGPLGAPSKAAEALRELQRMRPGDLRIARQLTHTLTRLDDPEGLETALAHQEGLERRRRPRMSCRLRRAELNVDALGQPERAQELLWKALEEEPSNRHVYLLLEPMLRQRGDFERLAQVLTAVAQGPCGPQERAVLLLRLGEIHGEVLGHPARAARAYRQWLRQDPDNLFAMRRLQRMARRAGLDKQLAVAIQLELDVIGADAVFADRRVELAELYQDVLGRDEVAEKLFVEVAEQAPPGSMAWLEAKQTLVRRRLAEGAWQEGTTLLQQLCLHIDGASADVLREEIAWLTTIAVGDIEGGEARWRELTTKAPHCRTAAWALLRIEAQRGSAAGRVQVLWSLADQVDDAALASALRLRAAMLEVLSGTGDLTRANKQLHDSLAVDEAVPEAALGLLMGTAKASPEWAEALGLLLEHVSDRYASQNTLALALANLHSGRIAQALDRVDRLLRADAGCLPGLVVVQQVAWIAGNREQEAKAWLAIAMAISDAEGRSSCFARAAALFEELGRQQEAAAAYRHALDAKPGDPSLLSRIERIQRARDVPQELEQLLSLRIHWEREPSRLFGLLFERATIRRERLGLLRLAARDWLKCLQLQPDNTEVLRLLAATAEQAGDLARALKWYGRLADVMGDPLQRKVCALKVAELLARCKRPVEAAEYCRELAEQLPKDGEVLSRLAELYMQVPDRKRAIATLNRLAQLSAGPADRADRMRRLASLYWRELHDRKQARQTLIAALEIDPINIGLLRDMRRLYGEMGLDEELVRRLDRAQDDLRDSIGRQPVAVALYKKLMRLAEWTEDRAALVAALGVLCGLNAVDAHEQQLYQRRVSSLAFDPRRALAPHQFQDTLAAKGARSPYGDVWRAVAGAVPHLFSRRQRRLGGQDLSGARQVERPPMIERLASTLDAGDFDLFVRPGGFAEIVAVITPRPALVIAEPILSRIGREVRFRIGRALCLLRDRTVAVEHLSLAEVASLIGGAIAMVHQKAATGWSPSGTQQDARTLQRLISRRARRLLPLAVNRLLQDLGQHPSTELLQEWMDGAVITANRGGLLACGDIVCALQCLVPSLGEPGRRRWQENTTIVQQSGLPVELLPFSVSRQYLSLRAELGLT